MPRHIEDDDDDVVKDGEGIRCPIHLMDAVQRRMVQKYSTFDADDHRPRHAPMTDDVRKTRRESRDAYVCDLTNAWKSPQRAKSSTVEDSDADADPMRRARDAMIKRATEAWRTPHRDALQPDLGAGPDVVTAVTKPSATAPNKGAAVEREKELERWQGRPISELTAAVEKRRSAEQAAFAQRLENAWKFRTAHL